MKRIAFLDGLRGISILLVITFHAFTRWAAVVPYGDGYAPVFKYGYLGVHLFFLISGFVILMTLEKNATFGSFIFKRALRLFPAMLIVTLIVFCTAFFLYERPSGIPQWKEVIPGLLFLEPSWITLSTGIKIKALEMAFWSLFVEVKFYVIFGLLYYWLGRAKAILGLYLLFVFAIAVTWYPVKYIYTLSYMLSLQYFGWFVSGCLAYWFFTERKTKYLMLAIVVAIMEIIAFGYYVDAMLFAAVLVALFMLLMYFEKARSLFSNRFLLFFGFISYPLYLIHENAMIALILKFHNTFPGIPNLLLPVIAIAILCLVSYFIAKTLEPLVRGWIEKAKTLLIR